jgi:hypothetical protein
VPYRPVFEVYRKRRPVRRPIRGTPRKRRKKRTVRKKYVLSDPEGQTVLDTASQLIKSVFVNI